MLNDIIGSLNYLQYIITYDFRIKILEVFV